MSMTDKDWLNFFYACVNILGPGDYVPIDSPSLCSFTTFNRLETDAGYYVHGIPRIEDVGDNYIKDFGVWGQPFLFADLAHVIIPRKCYWERGKSQEFNCGYREQDLDKLSAELTARDVPHRLSKFVLEIKLY